MSRFVKLLIVCVVFSGACLPAYSNSITDPEIIIRGGPRPDTLFINSVGSVVTINFAGTTGCTSGTQQGTGFPTLLCGVFNQSGETLITIDFFVTPAGQLPAVATCTTPGLCSATPTTSANGVIYTFFVNVPSPGDFWIEFINFSPDTQISMIANVPEPGTLGLMLTGIGALALRRRRARGPSSA